MDPKFAQLVEKLAPKYDQLRTMRPHRYGGLPGDMPKAGIYLFSEGEEHLYVGRSNDLRGRHGRHCRPGATWRQAAFAFHLARQKTGNLTASYKIGNLSRKGLALSPDFMHAFVTAKARIREMDYRYVEETDPTGQALLEIYCATVLRTRFNDFDNH